ncbi:ATP-binding protein [Meiothermus taiwanensis]|jgi:DNA-binding SARP family transcriptional activator|uniref:Bacterial transcriptional activator domain protein n=3 Tax=Meiothermus taiwanensis TaxID=172827 RepID=A0A399DYB5_9DEIN|nr:BTAD domain-containing putative transcriptional regulator [Meiothermus taiwanensis]AWR88052.1 AfsR/DnrI/RedD family transcriptional regulator [Meiothermus taiwanensis WR-220]RIH77167.1 Bacterial transcriptional activator domain protein [Meiothermus taiwanensis]
MLRLELLGQPRILHAVELRLPRKAVALLAYLAIEGCTPRSRLVDLLWSESDEEGGRRNLRQVLYQLGQTPVQAHLEVGRAQIGLCGFELDVEEFLEGHGCADSLRLWRGEFLQDLELDNASQFEVWLRHQRERLGSAYAKALGHQARELERKGDLRGALEAFQTLIHLDELQEQPHREAMRLYAALGQPEQALCQFKRLTEVLRDELGLEPLPETQALAEQIRQRREVPRAKPLAVNSPSLRAPLVGREQALKRLEAAWQSKNILLIAGQAGVGKSRLVQEFLADKGSYVALSGRPGDAGTPYASMTRWVRQALGAAPGLELRPWVRFEAARLVPELSDEAPPQLDEGGQVRFFQALCELLSQASGGSKIFLSEDEHFADPWSLKALAFGVSQGSRRLVATFRPDEVLPEVAQRYQEWQGSGAAEWLELEPLSEQEVAELVAHLSGRPARLFPQRLYRATSGNPLFVLETLRNLFELGELRQGPGGVWETPYDEATQDYAELPIAPSVRQTILSRLERQGASVRRCLEVAALIEEETFNSGTLAEATALSQWEVSEALERASGSRLIEAAGQGYRFSHELISRAIAESLKPDRRRLIAARLAQHYAQGGVHPARVAGYFQQAAMPLEAAQWWVRAALHAHGVLAFAEADRYYVLALAALPPDHPERFEIQTRRFYLARQVGNTCLEEQLEQLEAMAASARSAEERCRVWFYRGMVLDDQQDLQGAMEASRKAYQYGLEASPAEAFYPLIFVTHYQRDLGLLEEATADGHRALALARQLSPFHLAEAQLCHALTRMLQGCPDEAIGLLAEAEDLLRQNGPAPAVFWLLQERLGVARARVLNSLGRFEESVPQTAEVIEKARQGGVQRQELVGLLVRVEGWLGLGRAEEAAQDLERCTELARHLNWGWSEVGQLYAELELFRNNGPSALRWAERALEHAARNIVHEINGLYSRGGAWLALGERTKARADLERAIELHGGIHRFRAVRLEALQARLALTRFGAGFASTG